MKSSIALLKIRERLNKRSSQANKFVKNEAIQETVNKVVLERIRKIAKNSEDTETSVSDLQVLLKSESLSGKMQDVYFETTKIPTDYFKHINVSPLAEKDGCLGSITSDLREESSSKLLLADWSSQPSWDFDQTFHTLFNNKIRVYHNKDFVINKATLTYYKQPKYIRFPKTFQYDGLPAKDETWEFKDDFCELIIDDAVLVIAADIESKSVYQTTQERIKETE
jgi:hypothetical protein